MVKDDIDFDLSRHGRLDQRFALPAGRLAIDL